MRAAQLRAQACWGLGPTRCGRRRTTNTRTGTVPARETFTKPLNPDRWQPLTYTDANGNLVVQMFAGAQWGWVKAFAERSTAGDEEKSRQDALRPRSGEAGGTKRPASESGPYKGTTLDAKDAAPAKFGSTEYEKQAEELMELSAGLTDRQKMLVEYGTGVGNGASGDRPTQKSAPTKDSGGESAADTRRWMRK